MEASNEPLSDPSSEGSVKRLLITGLPAAILIVIAASQFIQCHAGTLTPWKGGGFGMFSSYDSVDNRFIRAYLLANQHELPCAVPDSLSRDMTILQTQPSESKMDDLGDAMGAMNWYTTKEPRSGFDSKKFRDQFPQLKNASDRPRMLAGYDGDYSDDSTLTPLLIRGVRIEVWRWSLNGSTLTAQKWMQATRMRPAVESKVN